MQQCPDEQPAASRGGQLVIPSTRHAQPCRRRAAQLTPALSGPPLQTDSTLSTTPPDGLVTIMLACALPGTAHPRRVIRTSGEDSATWRLRYRPGSGSSHRRSPASTAQLPGDGTTKRTTFGTSELRHGVRLDRERRGVREDEGSQGEEGLGPSCAALGRLATFSSGMTAADSPASAPTMGAATSAPPAGREVGR